MAQIESPLCQSLRRKPSPIMLNSLFRPAVWLPSPLSSSQRYSPSWRLSRYSIEKGWRASKALV